MRHWSEGAGLKELMLVSGACLTPLTEMLAEGLPFVCSVIFPNKKQETPRITL